MEVTPPPLRLELLDDTVIEFDYPLLKYIGYFKSAYEEGYREIREDKDFQLPWILWDWILAVLTEHEDIYAEEEGLQVSLRQDKTKQVKAIGLHDLYRMLRVTHFYDMPLVTDFLIKEVINRTLPLHDRELMLANPNASLSSMEELASMINEPIELLNQRYSLHRALLMRIYRLYMPIYDLYNLIDERYLPRITNVLSGSSASVNLLSKTAFISDIGPNVDIDKDNNDLPISIWTAGSAQIILTVKDLLVVGNNAKGKLGIDIRKNSGFIENYTKIDLPQVLTVSLSETHTLFLTVEGVYSAGENAFGQLGNGTNISRAFGNPDTIYLDESIRISAVTAAATYSLFLDDKGNVYFSGRTPNKNLTITRKSDTNINILSPTLLKLPENAGKILFISSSIDERSNHSILLDDKGDVYVFGNNSYGELSLGHRNAIDGVQKVTTLKSIVKARALYHCSFFIDSNRNLYACGSNIFGQLVDIDEQYITSAIAILSTNDVIDVAIRSFDIFVLKCDGLYRWAPTDSQKQKLDVEDLTLCVPSIVIEEEEKEVEKPVTKRKRLKALHCYHCGVQENLSIHQSSKHLFCSLECLTKLRAFKI